MDVLSPEAWKRRKERQKEYNQKRRPTDALEGFQARKRCEASESPYIPGYLDVYDLGMDPSQGGHSDDLACGPDVSSDCGNCGNDESGRISGTAPSRQNEM